MPEFDCDAWRAAYDTTSFEAQKAAYDEIREGSPEQICYDIDAARRACRGMGSVTEIGGWRGELAAALLEDTTSIWGWRNYEICAFAVGEGNRCTDPRYIPLELLDWPWESELAAAEMFVASHVVEHMRFEQFKLLTRQFFRFEHLHFQIPIPLDRAANWTGYDGTHIMDASWEDVNKHILSCGFALVECDETLTCRTYSR